MSERSKITARPKGHSVSKEEVSVQYLNDLAEGIGVLCARLMPYTFGGKPHSVATETEAEIPT